MTETYRYFLDKCGNTGRNFKIFVTECSMARRDELYEIKFNNILEVTHCNVSNNFQSTCKLSVENSTGHFDKPNILLPETENFQLIHS
jgi:hypothetical protein